MYIVHVRNPLARAGHQEASSMVRVYYSLDPYVENVCSKLHSQLRFTSNSISRFESGLKFGKRWFNDNNIIMIIIIIIDFISRR